MTLNKGWINRQFAEVEQDKVKWPDWMKRETDLRTKEQMDLSIAKQKENQQTVRSIARKAGGDT